MPRRRGLAAALVALSAVVVLARRRPRPQPDDAGTWKPVPRPRS